MQTVGLSWEHSFELAGVLAVTGAALAVPRNRHARFAGAFLRETAVIGALYGLWRLAGKLSVTDVDGAFRRGRWIAHAERDVGLPSEHAMQHLVLGHPLLVQAANLYYATMHFSMMLVFLLWLFLRHRARYRPVRQVMAWTTLGCLLIQLVPVAPPRMFPDLHIVDTGLLYNQSVYSNGLAADQMSAMPSVHVAWAVLVGFYVWRVSPSRWRFVGPLHAVLTVFVVLVTGNHWWADGIVAVGVLVCCAWGVCGVRTAWRRLRPGRSTPADVGVEPVDDGRHGAPGPDDLGLRAGGGQPGGAAELPADGERLVPQ